MIGGGNRVIGGEWGGDHTGGQSVDLGICFATWEFVSHGEAKVRRRIVAPKQCIILVVGDSHPTCPPLDEGL